MAEHILNLGKRVLREESSALLEASGRLDSSFTEAVLLLSQISGRLVVTGLGKSGHVGAKISSTLASTGTPSFYLHPSEALHGDFGMLQQGDALLALAYGGETREVVAVAQFAKTHNIPVIALTEKNSSLARVSQIVLDGFVQSEADTLGLAPTSSSTVALALGDALAVALMDQKKITAKHFAKLHPGGELGRRLAPVSAFMHPLNPKNTPILTPETSFGEILEGIGSANLGIGAILGPGQTLEGRITDGDVRRALIRYGSQVSAMTAKNLMTHSPRRLFLDTSVMEAVHMMEEFHITTLFVVNPETGALSGVVRLYDLMSAHVI